MTKVKFEELWEPWYIDELPHPQARMDTWKNIPEELIERFRFAKNEMEEVWNLLRKYDPTYD